MATKTVVCPECGAATAPGRYACTECGALLAAVGPAPRGRGAVAIAGIDDVAPDGEPGTAFGSGAAEVSADGEAPAVAAATAIASAAAPDGLVPESGVSAEPFVDGPAALPEDRDDGFADSGAFDEDAPLAAARPARQPDVLRDLPEAALPEVAPIATDVPAAAAASDPVAAATSPSWPPPGDRGPAPAPEPRTPAGAYLPPSAVLPPLDGVVGVGAMALPAVNQAVAGARSMQSGSSLAARSSAALTDALGSVSVTADAARRAIAVGAGLASLGMLLPWVNTLPGASPLASYLDRWGLAGPGLWLVLIGLVGLGAVAASSGRAATWPVGLPAIVTAAFLAGLVWPYAVGGFGRSIGTWVVLVGAVALLVGGLLDRRGRHDRGDATV